MSRLLALALVIALVMAAGCGIKGPPEAPGAVLELEGTGDPW